MAERTRRQPEGMSPVVPAAACGAVSLESILRTEELARRRSRPPDYEVENRSLAALAQALADSPARILQTLADTVLEALGADSAGLSLLAKDEQRFYWPAIAGAWKPHIGGGTPRDFGPCGDVLDRNAPLLFTHWERRYPYLLEATPLAEEGLLVPFSIGGKAVGTIWAIAHDDRRRFDAEDLRQLESLGRFAAAAYQAATTVKAIKESGEELSRRSLQLVRSQAEIQANRDSRRAALNLMEDAVQAREAMEGLTAELGRSAEQFRALAEREQGARADAEEANRLKDEFLATISHELRTPLNAMLGWLQLLRRGHLDPAKSDRALATIERNARAQHQIVSDLLEISGMVTGKLRIEPRLTDLVPVIEAAVDAVRPAAEAKGVDLRIVLGPATGAVSGDAVRLQQVVWNLLTNAVNYTPRGGHVDVRLESDDDQSVIVVHDTGEGISADFLPHVFTRFRQADGTTTRRHGGLGLGLAIVHYLVDAHGGRIAAASDGPGQGATFTVTLPIVAARALNEEVERADGTVLSHGLLRGLRVLVVDDDPDARDLLSAAFRHGGAEVRTASSARGALDLLRGWRAEVLVSDLAMPEQDGCDLLRDVRALPADQGGEVAAVAVTGYTSPEGRRRALAAGYQLFVSKPVDVEELAETIARLAAKG